MDPTPLDKDPALKGVVGIQNMGNTCYCNSTLQLIRACSEWDAFCLSHNFTEKLAHLPEGDANKRILLAYQDILKSLWSAHLPAYVRPLGFISEVCKAVKGTVYESFGIPVPNDSHEYLVYLLDHFHEALRIKTAYQPKEIAMNMDPVQKMRLLAENGWNRAFSNHTSEVVQLFFGMIRKTIRCTSCQNKTYQWEVFNSLKIPCDGQTFMEWIEKEVNETSEIEGYSCDNCKGRHTATIASHLWKLPDNLFVTLRRFHYNGTKNMTMCPYDGSPISFQRFYAEESEEAQKPFTYDIRGVSDHHGTHMGGHYTAQFKHPMTHQWWHFDDERARPLSHPQFSSSNYIFFFKRQ